MSDLAYIKLSEDDVRSRLISLPGWEIVDAQLSREYAFKTYKDGVVFASAIGFVADKLNHHPDIHVSYAKVRVAVNTHDVGGLSPYDFELARRIDSL